jgi:hypothetical protein
MNLPQTAYHEAGHAVAGILLPGLKLVNVWLEPLHSVRVGWSQGYCRTKRLPWVSSNVESIFICAGATAENLWRESQGMRPASYLAGWKDDNANLDQLWDHVPPGPLLWQRGWEIRKARRAARKMLSQPDVWRALTALAELLFERGRLSGREARKVFKAALRAALPTRTVPRRPAGH